MVEQRRSHVSREIRIESRRAGGAIRGARDPEALGNEVSHRVQEEVARRGLDLGVAFFSRIRAYASFLAIWGERMSLTARPQDPGALAFHTIDSLMPLALDQAGQLPGLAKSLQPGKEVLDLGSGAGFPGLVLASAVRAHFTLCEARRKRTTFLRVVAEELGLFDLTVKGDHVTPASFDAAHDLVTTRALGDAGNFHG